MASQKLSSAQCCKFGVSFVSMTSDTHISRNTIFFVPEMFQIYQTLPEDCGYVYYLYEFTCISCKLNLYTNDCFNLNCHPRCVFTIK
jgi:hypothetical protein